MEVIKHKSFRGFAMMSRHFAVTLFLGLAAAGIAEAQDDPPPRPSSFFGTVTADGNPVSAGTLVAAAIGGAVFDETETFLVDGMSVFRLDVPADDPETAAVEGGEDGDAITFRVNGSTVAQAAVWQSSTYQRADLTATLGTDLAITKDDGLGTVGPGETLTYLLTVTNAGPFDATGVVIEDFVPPNTSFIVASDGGTEAGGGVTWPAFDLPVGFSVTRTLTVEVALSFPAGTTEIVNVATVRSDGADGVDPDGANNTATDADALAGGPDLVVEKSADLAEVAPGQDVVYTLTLSNNGFQGALDTELSDTLPPEVIFLTASDDGREVGGVVTWPAFTLDAGASATRTIRVRLPSDVPPSVAELVNTASATSSNGPDLDPSDNTDVHVLPVVREPDLAVLSVDPGPASIDPQSLAVSGLLTVEIANAGNSDVLTPFDVAVFEDLDGDGAFTPAADNLLGQAELSGGVLTGETVFFDVTVGGTVLFRNNLLYAFADAGEAISELDETNNVEHSARGCEAIPTPEDFAPVVELSWPLGSIDAPGSIDSLSTPLVVQLTDDNGDGRRDDRDVPDLVFVTYDLVNTLDPQPRLRAIRGDTGAPIFDAFPPISGLFQVFALTGAAAGDIDRDGRPEIVVSTFDFRGPSGRPNRIAAYEHNGALKWVSPTYSTHPDGDTLTNRDNPTIADLDRDGVPEILVGANVFNANGSLRWTGAGGHAYQSARNADAFDSGAISIAADLDLAGDLEVVTGNTAYRSDGSIYWQLPLDDGYPAVANFDADDFPEIVVVSRGNLRLHEHDGAVIWTAELPGAGAEAGGAPTVANFDADPEPEIGVAGSTQYTVFEADGSVKWQSATQDGSSNMTGSTVFDLDGNGRFEVIYRDETALRIYRGEDGVVLFEEQLSSITLNEQPVVADVDRDGNAEIVVTSDVADAVSVPRRTRGLRIFGDANDNWVAARPVWNQHAYHIDNVADDGHTIPADEVPSWLSHNTYRANVAPAAGAFASPDVSASRITVDLAAYPTIVATARIGNGGTTFVPGGLPVAFYDGDPAAGGQLIGTATVAADLDPGELADVSVSFLSAGFGAAQVFAVADDDGTGQGRQTECDEANNVHGIAYDTNAVGLLLTLADGQDAVQPGEVFTYTLTIANGSVFGRTGVAPSHTLSPFVTVVAASDGGMEVGGVVTWPAFDLAGAATAMRTLTLEVDPAVPLAVGSITNTATVTDDGSQGPDPTPDNNTAFDTNAVLTVRADAGGPYSGDEGAPIGFDASASSDRDGTIVAYEWDLDLDGQFDDATGVTASRAFHDDGTFQVAVRVTDDSGEQDTDTAEVVVGNLPPSVTADPDRTLTEGDATTLTATAFTDPGAADSHSATIDWGDGTVDAGVVDPSARTVAGGHDYPDNGVFPVEVCVTDDDGATGCDSFTVTVENSAPIVVEEGDVDLRTWTAEHLAGAANWSVAADGQSVRQTVNTDPSVFYGPFTAIGVTLEGSIRVNTTGDDDFIGFMLGFSPGDFSNPNADYLMVDWKQANQNAFGANAQRGLAISRVRGVPTTGELWGHIDEASNGSAQRVDQLQRGATLANTGWSDLVTYTFTFETSPANVKVFVNGALELDVDGDFNFGSGRFAFYNFSQGDVTYNAFTSQGLALLEGEVAHLQVPFNDLGVEDTHTATIDWRDGTVEPGTVSEAFGSGEVTGFHLYPDDAELDVEVCVTDDDGGEGCGGVPVTVFNVAPEVEAGGDRLVFTDEGLSLEAVFSDPGVLDVHTATIDWGDGTVEAGAVDETGGSGTATGSHFYAAGGDHTVEVCVDDGEGGVGCDSFDVRTFDSVVDLAVGKRSAVTAVRPGGQVVFEVVVVNRGTRSLEGVVVVDTLPPFLDFAGASGGGVFDAASRTVTWIVPSLPSPIDFGGNLGVGSTFLLTVTLQAQADVPFGEVVTNIVQVSDDGRFGADANPADNSASASLRLWDAFTPIVEARPPVNLSRDVDVVTNVSSTLSVSTLSTRGVDGNLSTSWFTECGDAANQGASPFFEVELPRLATVRELRMFGNRQNANGRDFFSGVFQLVADDGTVLYDSGDVALPAPTRDLTLVFPEVAGVRRARFTATADESCNPGLAELEVIGFFGDAGVDTLVEGSELRLTSSFTDSEPAELHTATVDWGDGAVEPGVVVESGGNGTVGGVHVYPDDSVQTVAVCVTDEAGHTGCDAFEARVLNAVPNVNDNDDIDLRLFQAEGTSGGFNWVVEDDGRSVRQTINNGPTFFYGDFQAFGTRIEGEIEVITGADDDFIGFALGFEPGDTANQEADYLLVQWKQGNQSFSFGDCSGGSTALRGLSVSRVSGVPVGGEFWSNSNHPCNGLENGLEQLARGIRFGSTGWQDFVKYKFTFEYTPTRLRVFVDDVLEIDIEGDFPDGRLTFFNHSLANVRYSAFTIAALVGVEGSPLSLLSSFVDPGVLDVHTSTVDWGDGAVTPGTVAFAAGFGTVTASHVYADNFEVVAEVCVADDDGGTGCGVFPVNVLNAAPVVDAGDDLMGFVSLPFQLDQPAYTDPGTLDTHTATVDWGDGTPVEPAAVDGGAGSGTVSAGHVYTAEGTFQVTVCVTDDDGGTGCDSLSVEVTERPPEVSIGDASVVEGDPDAGGTVQLLFPVTLSLPAAFEVAVSYATADTGTATADVDYLAASGVLTFAPGTTETVLAIEVVSDLVDELDETFGVVLAYPVLAEILDGEAQGTIVDDDEALISIDDVTVDEGDEGTTDAVFTVTLSTEADREIRVSYATAPETATAGVDYLTADGLLVFPAGTTSLTLAVEVVGDLILEELEETFRVELTDPVETAFADDTGLGTILDDEECPGPNLLVNPGAEIRGADRAATLGWNLETGDWRRHLGLPEPFDGRASFAAGDADLSELYQDVDVAAFAARIDGGIQPFELEGFVRTSEETPPDVVRIVVEYRDATNSVVLEAFDSGEITSPSAWQRVNDVTLAPAGTRFVRVRLVGTRFTGTSIDGFVDALVLRPLRAPTLTIDDVTVYEQFGPAVFTVSLACAWEHEVIVAYATADDTALAVEDYLSVAGTLTFPVGTTELTVSVPIVEDDVDEPTETFFVELSDPASTGEAVFLDPLGVGTILNDDFCPRSHGYWKTHPEEWPVTWLLIGGVEYEVDELEAFLDARGGDQTLHLALQLVATKLNLARGSDPYILPVVEAADSFLEVYPPGSNPRGEPRAEAEALKDQLDAYVNTPCPDD